MKGPMGQRVVKGVERPPLVTVQQETPPSPQVPNECRCGRRCGCGGDRQ